MRYKTLEELLDMIEGPLKTKLFSIYQTKKESFLKNTGSQFNHQPWQGGYIDHVVETMNIARLLHQVMTDKRRLDFKLSDALIVLFLHDIEKSEPLLIQEQVAFGMSRPKAKDKVRYRLLYQLEVGEMLTDEQRSAIDHIEGEHDSYINTKRVMNPLAAFCHMCDIASARIWFNRPGGDLESWGHRQSESIEDHNLWGV